MQIFKILKYRTPLTMYEHYQISKRQALTYIKIITPMPNTQFIYKSSILWNTIRPKLGIQDMGISTSQVKTTLRNLIHSNQHSHSDIEWLPTHDFNPAKLSTVPVPQNTGIVELTYARRNCSSMKHNVRSEAQDQFLRDNMLLGYK